MALVAGIDDAGRGCILGPLVVAGVMLRGEDLPKLKQLGVKDSKLLTAHRRDKLAEEIQKIVEKYYVIKLSPRQIDVVVRSGRRLHKLNYLEAQAMAEVIQKLRPDIVYVDASDVVERRFKHQITEHLPFRMQIVSEHKADRNYAVVSAASIIAKVERDKEIAALTKIYGPFGSGYPSDSRTILFLKDHVEKFGEYEDFVRKSWKPARRIRNEKGSKQTKLM